MLFSKGGKQFVPIGEPMMLRKTIASLQNQSQNPKTPKPRSLINKLMKKQVSVERKIKKA